MANGTKIRTSIQIKSLKGATITLTLDGPWINASVTVNGREHSFCDVKVDYSSLLGSHIVMGSNKAQITEETRKLIAETFTAAIAAWKAETNAKEAAKKAEFLASPAGKSWLLGKKMNRADSDM